MLVLVGLTLLTGCSDPIDRLRTQEIKSYLTSWTDPKLIAELREEQRVPIEYAFVDLSLTSRLVEKGNDSGIFEFTFRFEKMPSDTITVVNVCFFDVDTPVMQRIKVERFAWSYHKLVSHDVKVLPDASSRTGANKVMGMKEMTNGIFELVIAASSNRRGAADR